MNFLDCLIEPNASGMTVHLADGLFSVSGRSHRTLSAFRRQAADLWHQAGAHHRVPNTSDPPKSGTFTALLDVVEPMGMETLVFFPIGGKEVCGARGSCQPTSLD
jgi:multiple sugar transport system ATP-binding protein